MGNTAEAFNRSPVTAARFLYVIEDTAKGTLVHLTNTDRNVVVHGLPATDGGNPQTFTSSPIAHNGGRKSQQFQEKDLLVMAPKNDGNFAHLYLSSISATNRVKIMRISSYADNPTDLEYGVDTLTVEEGLINAMTFTDDTIAAKVVPEAYAQNFSIPRHWFTRTCNFALYGQGCGVDENTHKWDTTVVSINRERRQVVVLGQNAAEQTHWAYGTMSHDNTGVRATVVLSEHLGDGNTRITTNNWLPFIETGHGIRLLPGCRRTPADCRDKFNNAENFGGFHKIPTRNIAEHGV